MTSGLFSGRRVAVSGLVQRTGRRIRALIDAYPRFAFVVAVATGLISVTLLTRAVDETDAFALLPRLLGGAATGAVGLLIVGQLLRGLVQDDGAVGGGIRGSITLALGVGITIAGVLLTDPWVAPAGLLVVIVGILMVMNRGAELVQRQPAAWMVGGLLLIAVMIVPMTAITAGQTAWAILVSVCGLTAAKLALTPLLQQAPAADAGSWVVAVGARARRAFLASAVVTVVGVALLASLPWLSGAIGGPLLGAAGGSALVVGLSGLALAALNLAPDARWVAVEGSTALPAVRRRLWWIVGGIGGALVVAGAAATGLLLAKWFVLAVALMIGALAIGSFLVFRGEALIALVILGFLLAWALTDRTVTVEEIGEGREGIVLVLGDSFAAGQGAAGYLPHTNTQADTGNSCRRSSVSYGRLVAASLHRDVIDAACSGAASSDIHLEGQKDDPTGAALVPGAEPQLSVLNGLSPEQRAEIDLVLMNIGGNDAGFSRVAAACLLPTDCHEKEFEIRSSVRTLTDDLQAMFEEVARQLPDVPIVSAPYPQYVGFEDCGQGLSGPERNFIARFISDVNAAVEHAAGSVPDVHIGPSPDEVYVPHTQCGKDPGANLIHLLPTEGSISQRLNPGSQHKGSAHPNELGHRCVAGQLAGWLLERPEFDLAPAEPGTPVPTDGCRQATEEEIAEFGVALGQALAEDEMDPTTFDEAQDAGCVLDRESGECFDLEEWVGGNARRAGLLLGGPLLAIAVGAAMAALAFVRLDLPFGRFLVPPPPKWSSSQSAGRRGRLETNDPRETGR